MFKHYLGITQGNFARILTKNENILRLLRQIAGAQVISDPLGKNVFAVTVVISDPVNFLSDLKDSLTPLNLNYRRPQYFVLKKTLLLDGLRQNIFIIVDKEKSSLYNFYLSVVSFAISFLLEFEGFFCIHGGFLFNDLGGTLITGGSGCGKSTALSNLALSGFYCLTDHYGLIYRANSTVKIMSLFEMFASFGLQPVDPAIVTNPRPLDITKYEFAFENTRLNQGAKLDIIIFPEISDAKKTKIFKLSRNEAIKKLIAFSSGAINNDNGAVKQRQLSLLMGLARQCKSYIFASGRDMIADPCFRSYDLLKMELVRN